MRAVILAAGEGKRLRPHFSGPKPLTPLLGLALIERNILSICECGITDFTIITGYRAREIEDYLGSGSRYGVNIEYLYNPDWKLGNGTSAFTINKSFRKGEKFILVMADHVFDPRIFDLFIQDAKRIKEEEILLAADSKLKSVHDLQECTKIRAEQDGAVRLGKNLSSFNAVDCGLFASSSALLGALSEAISRSCYALTDAVNILAARGQVKLHFIAGQWADVDDLPSYRYAEKVLIRSVIPPKDGMVSRLLNRKISTRITSFLAQTRITPNQVTFISFLTALASSLAFATLHPLLGGILAQLSSVLDGVDGEIARLKFMRSSYGGLFDAVLDRYADFFIILGMTWAWYAAAGNSMPLIVGMAALAGLPMSMLIKEKFHVLTGKMFRPELHDGKLQYLPANRDGRLFVIMLGGILNQLPATLVLLAVVTHVQAIARLLQARKLMKIHS